MRYLITLNVMTIGEFDERKAADQAHMIMQTLIVMTGRKAAWLRVF